MKTYTLDIPQVKLTYSNLQSPKDRVVAVGHEDYYNILRPLYDDECIDFKECFKVLLLNAKCEVLGCVPISEGGLMATFVDVRNIMQAALLSNAACIVLSHNHPSGHLTTSYEDRQLTQHVHDACRCMAIRLLDHVILTRNGYISMSEVNLMPSQWEVGDTASKAAMAIN